VGPPAENEGSPTTATDLGLFTAGSIYGQITFISTAAATQKHPGGNEALELELDANNLSTTLGPAVPEPMSLTLLGIGAPLMGAYLLRRRMTRA